MNWIQKAILKDHPNYDFERYRFKSGDAVIANDGARIIVEYSALDYVNAFVVRRGLKYRELGECYVDYSDLPYYKKGEFISTPYKISTSLHWKYGDIRKVEGNMTVLLIKEHEFQDFYAYVLESPDNGYYLYTRIAIRNPHRDYISKC